MPIKIVQTFQDKQTLGRLQNKDQEAFIEVYDKFAEDLYRFVYFKVGDGEEAKDLTSMIFLKAWNHIQANSLTSSSTLRALLYKIARNAIIDYYRETGSKVASLDDPDHPIDLPDEKKDLAAESDQKTDLERIKSKLPLLKEEYREVIILKYINDLEIDEIADITGKKKGNIRVLIHRALNALRELLEQDNL